MAKIKLVSALVLIVLVIIIILQNTVPVETRILFMTVTMPRAALLAITFLAGAATGLLGAISISSRHKKSKKAEAGDEPQG